MSTSAFYRGRRGDGAGAPGPGPSPRPPSPAASSGGGAPPPRAGHTTARGEAYRRRAVKPRRRRRGLGVRLLKPLVTAAVMVGLPVAAAVLLVTSPRFQVRAVTVEGVEEPLAGWVESRLRYLEGERLLTLRLSEVATAVGEHRWIESLEVSRRLPDAVGVEVHPRRPVAVVLDREPPVYTDATGEIIAPVGEELPGAPRPEPGELLQVSGTARAPEAVPSALAVREDLARARPAWGRAVTRVDVLGEGDFRLHTTALPFPLLVRAGEVEPRVRWLEHVLPRLVETLGEPGSVDLRFDRRIILETRNRSPERGT